MRGRLAPLLLSLSLFLVACPKTIPDGREGALGPEGSDAAQSLKSRVDAIDAEAGQVLAAVDDALWRHWTRGEPLELAKASAGHDGLFGPATLDALRRAQAQGVEPRRAAHLERWLLGELVSRALTSDTEAVASLEAGATFTLDGKDIAWREVPRLLGAEKSAVRRRALAAGAATVAGRLEPLLDHREDKAAETLANLSAGSPRQLAVVTRELDLEALAATARALLTATDATWSATLATLSELELKLPPEALTKADLPRLLKVPAAVDGLFPRAAVAPRALDTLAGLGLYGRAGMSLELSEGATKRPLPLTVAPSPKDVRVCFKPQGGLRDQTQLLSELGVALALSAASTGHASTDRLGDPARALSLGLLLSGLAAEPAWLTARGIAEAQQPDVIRAARALSLYAVRRAALGVLLHVETLGLPDPEARATAVALEARALGVKVPPEEGAGLRRALDDGLRAGTSLKAALLAAEARAGLPERYFSAPDSGPALLAGWASGTALEVRPSPRAVEALCRALGVPVAAEALDGGAVP